MEFFLGTHQPYWLRDVSVPLFVSRRRLCEVRAAGRAGGAPWALDSGGFSELTLHGGWTVTTRQYADEVCHWRESIPGMAFAAQQDWMCEPAVRGKTGLTVAEHQRRTVENYLELRDLAPSLPWLPVLQGWHYGDYLRHLEDYGRAGVDLRTLPRVGLGSVCRRQNTDMAEGLIRDLAGLGIRLHAFGFKVLGLRRAAGHLKSSDSMSWSMEARHSPPLPDCRHRNCANCRAYALRWYGRVLRLLGAAGSCTQGVLFA